MKRKKLFGLKHPGGSIGANLAQEFNQNNTNRSGDNTITTTTTTNTNTNNSSSITVQAPIIPPSNLMSATTSTTTRLSSNSSSMLSLKEMELESYSSVDDTDEKRSGTKIL